MSIVKYKEFELLHYKQFFMIIVQLVNYAVNILFRKMVSILFFFVQQIYQTALNLDI